MDGPFTYINMRVNGSNVSNNFTFSNTTVEELYFMDTFELIQGFGIIAGGVVSNFNYNWDYTNRKMGYKYSEDYKIQAMNSFKIISNDGNKNVCASAKIDVFGVRA